MKKGIIALALAVTLSTQAQASGQKHRHHDNITATTTTGDSVGEGVVAYSDTSSVDTTTVSTTTTNGGYDVDMDIDPAVERVLDILGGFFSKGMGLTLAILMTIIVLFFLLLPVIAIIAIIWLIVRNRNRRYRLAEKAMENGQQIPQELLREERRPDSDLWRRGIRNVALGLGLVALFYCLGANELTGIGWLVAFYGGGQAFIGRNDRNNNHFNQTEDDQTTI